MRALVLFLFLLASGWCQAADYAVVVSSQSSIGTLDEHKVRDIFLKKRNFDGGKRLVPVNLLGEASVRRTFESHILDMDRNAINRYWISNHFQGVSPPATQASLASVKKFVERVDGAIGYLPLDMVDASLKVVYEF